MERLGLGMHLLVLVALVVNLWFGGDYIEAWAGHLVAAGFEAALIFAYLVIASACHCGAGSRHNDRSAQGYVWAVASVRTVVVALAVVLALCIALLALRSTALNPFRRAPFVEIGQTVHLQRA